MKLILASSSPRRIELLSEAGYTFETAVPRLDETRLDDEPPDQYVCRLALEKARAVRVDSTVVIGADTVVVLGDEFLTKPSSRRQAKEILQKLSGKRHIVYTGVAVACSSCGRQHADYDKTVVHFNSLTEPDILRYIDSGEPLDKAGAYGIQGMGSFLVRGIEGELDTVIGLPMKLLRKMLKEHHQCLSRI